MAYKPPALTLTAPDKGSFPLDHEAVCRPLAQRFLACLKEHDRENVRCREHSRAYLECRMERGLMAKEDLSTLGFNEDMEELARAREAAALSAAEARNYTGYVAGVTALGSTSGAGSGGSKGAENKAS